MDLNIIFNKTAKASRAPLPWVGGLSSQSKRVLSLVDGKQSVQDILRQSENQPQNEVLKILQKLETDGYIQRLSAKEAEPDWLKSLDTYGVSSSSMIVEEIDTAALNFGNTTFEPAVSTSTKEVIEQKQDLQTKVTNKPDINNKSEEEIAVKAKREAERKAKAESVEKIRLEALEQAKRIAEAKAKAQQEVARIEREKAEAAAKAKAEEEARLKAEAEEKARLEAERIEREKAEAAAKAKAEEEENLEAESIEQEEAKAAAKAKAEAEEQARQEAMRKAQEEVAEEYRLEAERIAREEEAAKTKFNTEDKARTKEILSTIILNKFSPKLIKPLLISTPIVAVLMVALIHIINLSMLIKPVEDLASNSIGEPVKVQEVHAALFPEPRLILSNITIGKDADIKIDTVSMRTNISILFNETKTLKSLEIANFTLRPTDLGRQLQWINTAAKSDKLEIKDITLKQISFNIPGLELEPFNGKLSRAPSGELNNVTLVNASRSVTLQLTPQNNSCAVKLTASAWQPPFLNQLDLDEVTATGIVNQNQANFSQIEAKAFGGTIKAQGVIDWAEHLSTSGNFELIKITLPRILSAFSSGASIDGTLNVSAAFASKAAQASELVEDAEVNTNFEVLNGKINGVALSHAVMSGSASKPAQDANFTRFDTLTGNLQFKNGQYKYKQFELKTEQFRARGNLDIESDQIISGKVSAALTSKSLRRQASFNIGGKVTDVILQ